MQQTGEYLIAAPVQQVWDGLNDPDVLGACITGCQEITRIDETHFAAKVKAKIGPVNATFQAELELKDLNPPHGYTIDGSVKGGAAGFAKGGAQVQLADAGSGQTQLTYQVDANVGGKLAQIGSRLVDGAARKIADEFFAAFSAHMSGDTGEAAAAEPTAPAPETQSTSGNPRYEPSGRGMIWIIAFVVLATAMILAV